MITELLNISTNFKNLTPFNSLQDTIAQWEFKAVLLFRIWYWVRFTCTFIDFKLLKPYWSRQ